MTQFPDPKILCDENNIAHNLTLSPVGGKSFKATVMMTQFPDPKILCDENNIAHNLTLSPVGGKSFKATVMYSNPPDNVNISNDATTICPNLQKINNKCYYILKLLNKERVLMQIKNFIRKFKYLIESNTLGYYSELKREISGQIATITNKNNLYAIEISVPLMEAGLILFTNTKMLNYNSFYTNYDDFIKFINEQIHTLSNKL